MKLIKIFIIGLLLTLISCTNEVQLKQEDTVIVKSVKELNWEDYKYRVILEINDNNNIKIYTDTLYQVSDTIELITK